MTSDLGSVIVIIQARMSSSRLPGKVLFRIGNQTMLEILLQRVGLVRGISKIVVATSQEFTDDQIESECNRLRVDCFRGSLDNVLQRFYDAAIAYDAKTVVRITADCPFIDPKIVEYVICMAQSEPGYALVTNRLPLSFPDGMDVDVISFDWLEYAYKNAYSDRQKEHIVTFYYDEKLPILNIEDKRKLFLKIRLTLDYMEDFKLMEMIFNMLPFNFQLSDIIYLYKKNKLIFQLNSNLIPKNYYQNFIEYSELKRHISKNLF